MDVSSPHTACCASSGDSTANTSTVSSSTSALCSSSAATAPPTARIEHVVVSAAQPRDAAQVLLEKAKLEALNEAQAAMEANKLK